MAVALIAPSSRWLDASGGPRRESTVARSEASKLRLAVGFDADAAWISAQYGSLAVQKHTLVRPRETRVVVQYEADVVVIAINVGRLVVARGARRVHVSSDDTAAACCALLIASPAVLGVREMCPQLDGCDDLRRPEASLKSVLSLVMALALSEGTVSSAERGASSFLQCESQWIELLGAILPWPGISTSRPAGNASDRRSGGRNPAPISNRIARFPQTDSAQCITASHGWVGSDGARGAA